MPSKLSRRKQNNGFTLLEAMLSVAILGMVLAATYTLLSRSLGQQAKALQSYELTMMARSVLDEYIITYPDMARQGTYDSTYHWTVSEAPERPQKPTEFDQYFSFVRITVSVSKATNPNITEDLSTVVARRAPRI